MNRVTVDQLQRIMPHAGPRAGVFCNPLNDAMLEFGIETPLRQAAFLAQVAHESGELRYVREIASGLAYNERKDLGNTTAEALRAAGLRGDFTGPYFKGRGLIQLTGYYYYRACGQALGLDLINSPTLLELPVYAARSAAWFWHEHDLNWFADGEDFDGLSDVINRGRKTARVGDANGYADRLKFYERAKGELL